jgi:hypothetical protein
MRPLDGAAIVGGSIWGVWRTVRTKLYERRIRRHEEAWEATQAAEKSERGVIEKQFDELRKEVNKHDRAANAASSDNRPNETGAGRVAD